MLTIFGNDLNIEPLFILIFFRYNLFLKSTFLVHKNKNSCGLAQEFLKNNEYLWRKGLLAEEALCLRYLVQLLKVKLKL